MKKNILFLLAVMTLGIVSCNRDKVSNADLVLIDHGNMSFYDVEAQKLMPFEKETDSVLNLLFDDNNQLYYTVLKGDNLMLKKIDMSKASPAPQECAYWNMSLQNAIEEMTGDVNSLCWDKNNQYILFSKIDYDYYNYSTMVYDPSTNKVRQLFDDEALDLYGFNNPISKSHFFTTNNQFYYVNPAGEICLSDKINFKQAFADEEELTDLTFEPERISPDGKRLVFSSAVYWGEGWGFYGLANLDGSAQRLLDDSDIWNFTPDWLADGSLVYVGKAPLPKDDPAYEEDWNTTQPCIKLLKADNSTVTLSLGETFAVKPFGEKKVVEKQGNLEGCDVAILDNGKVTFYNSSTGEYVPFVNETDSVINGVFAYGDDFYYTVSIGGRLYLKEIFMSQYFTDPTMHASWGLKLDDCISETYGKASTLVWLPAFSRIGISHNFSWDFYNFADIKFYALGENRVIDGWSEDEDVETDVYDEEFMQYENDLEHFVSDQNQYYYITDEGEVCISDKINFEAFCSDPAYCEDPEFSFYSIDPTRTMVAYCALIEWGDLGHGPLCLASLDGKVQKAFEGTDASDLTWGWLPDGSLLYVGEEPRPTDDPNYNAEWNNTKPCIKIVHRDGTEELFSHASDFVVNTK